MSFKECTAKETLQMLASASKVGTSGSAQQLFARIAKAAGASKGASNKTKMPVVNVSKQIAKKPVKPKTEATRSGPTISFDDAVRMFVYTGYCAGDCDSIKASEYHGPPIQGGVKKSGYYVRARAAKSKTAVKKVVSKPAVKKVVSKQGAARGVRLSASDYFHNVCGGKLYNTEPQLILQPDGASVWKKIKMCNDAWGGRCPKWVSL